MSTAIQANLGDRLTVVGNPSRPRRGAFEVNYKADDENQLTTLFSKLSSGHFPSPEGVVHAIKTFEADGSVPNDIEPAEAPSICALI